MYCFVILKNKNENFQVYLFPFLTVHFNENK